MIPLLLLACALDLGPKQIGPVEARLRVFVPAEGVGHGLAWVRFTLDVTGPPGLEVDGPRLEDARAAWRVVLSSSAWNEGGIERSLRLEQTKAGPAPLPGVALRVRESPGGDWHEMEWSAPLHEPRGVPPPEPVPDLPPVAWWPWLTAALVLAAVALSAVALRWAWRKRPVESLPPAERARRALAEARSYDDVERALRTYTAERFGVAAGAMTRAELVAAVRPQDEAAAADLDEALARCEEARFGVSAGEGEPARIGTVARRYIDATAQEGKAE